MSSWTVLLNTDYWLLSTVLLLHFPRAGHHRHHHHAERVRQPGGGSRVGQVGRRDRRRRRREHRRHGGDRAALHGPRHRARRGPATSSRRTSRPSEASHDWIFSLDADERVTPALAGEVRAVLEAGPACAGYRGAPGEPLSGPLDTVDRLVPRPPAAALRPAQAQVGRAVRPRVGAGRRRGRSAARGASSTIPIATSRTTCGPSIGTRAWRPGSCSRTAGAPGHCGSCCTPTRRSSGITSSAEGSGTARPASSCRCSTRTTWR